MKKAFPIGTFIFSAICLFNPILAGIDLLPDALGFGLMLLALYSLTVVKYSFEELFNRYKLLFILSLIQLFAIFFINTSFGTEKMNVYEKPTMILIDAFVIALMEVIFLLPCLKETLKTMEQTAGVYNGKLEGFSTFFVWTHALCSLIPETLVLTQFSYEAENPLFPFSWYPYTNLFRMVFGLFALIVGIVWLVKVIRFYQKCAKSENILAFKTSDETDLQNQKRKNILRYNSSYLVLFIGFFFSLNLHFEEINYLPNLLVGILICFYFIMMRKDIPVKPWHYVLCGGLVIISVAQNIVYGSYLKKFIPEASLYKPDAYNAYLPVRLLSFTERLLTTALVLLALYQLFIFLKKTTKVEYENNPELSEKSTKKLVLSYQKRVIATAICIGLGILLTAFDGLFHLYADWIRFAGECVIVVGLILYSLLVFEIKDNLKDDFIQMQ